MINNFTKYIFYIFLLTANLWANEITTNDNYSNIRKTEITRLIKAKDWAKAILSIEDRNKKIREFKLNENGALLQSITDFASVFLMLKKTLRDVNNNELYNNHPEAKIYEKAHGYLQRAETIKTMLNNDNNLKTYLEKEHNELVSIKKKEVGLNREEKYQLAFIDDFIKSISSYLKDYNKNSLIITLNKIIQLAITTKDNTETMIKNTLNNQDEESNVDMLLAKISTIEPGKKRIINQIDISREDLHNLINESLKNL